MAAVDVIPALVLGLVLCSIGWVFGYASALVCASALWSDACRRSRLVSAAVGVVLGAACLSAFVGVLARLGYVAEWV